MRGVLPQTATIANTTLTETLGHKVDFNRTIGLRDTFAKEVGGKG
jgi:hypothetical protein